MSAEPDRGRPGAWGRSRLSSEVASDEKNGGSRCERKPPLEIPIAYSRDGSIAPNLPAGSAARMLVTNTSSGLPVQLVEYGGMLVSQNVLPIIAAFGAITA